MKGKHNYPKKEGEKFKAVSEMLQSSTSMNFLKDSA